MPVARSPRIWALLGAHQGDNNQILAVAESLGLAFEAKPLRYNGWRHLQPRLLGATLRSLTPQSRASVTGDPPDLTISTGHRSVPVVREIRRRSRGQARSIHIGYPRVSPTHFDLVVTTPEYPVPDAPNVMRIPFALTRRPEPRNCEALSLDGLPRPRRLIVLGGPTLYWRLATDEILAAITTLLEAASRDGGSAIVVASPRTPGTLADAVKRRLEGSPSPARYVPAEGPPNYRTLLDSADAMFVTADSVAMVSDALATGKPIGLIPIGPSIAGRAYTRLLDRLRPGARMWPRDLRFFWAALKEMGLAGTLDEPRGGPVPDLNAMVAERVGRLLER